MDPDMPFDIFREQFEKGLHPKFRKLYITLADEDMNREAVRKTIRKIHEINETAQEEKSTPHPYNCGYSRPHQYNQRWGHTPHREYNDNHHKDTYNSGPSQKYTDLRDTLVRKQSPHEYRRQNQPPIPHTRGRHGQPRCQDCNKYGHYSCKQAHQTSTRTSKDDFRPPPGSRPPHKQRTRPLRRHNKRNIHRNHLRFRIVPKHNPGGANDRKESPTKKNYSGHRTEITEIELGGATIPMDFLVNDASPYPVILGAQFMKETRPFIDCNEESITIKRKHGTAKIKILGLEPDTRLDELDPEKTKHQHAPTETQNQQ
ncbi:hypothetical protein ABEB36_012966 [Hypothenemus hampei]|uniref:Reverse transcriptase domain-containing protein n=1 Tax=Hypothenemus hampei TaxID=57062 RepID=A0ABD1E6C4_HYPHA